MGQIFIPAPVGGLDFTGDFFDGDSRFAMRLDNLLCRKEGLRQFPGSVVTGGAPPSPLRTVFSAISSAGVPEVWVTTLAGVYQLTAGAYGALAIALTNAAGREDQCVSFSVDAGNYTLLFNGVDSPKIYNGAAWAAASITGPTLTNVTQGVVYRRRLYMTELGKLGFWYLNPNAITGAAVFYNAGTLAQRGGSVACISILTLDGGEGSNDLLLLFTTQGELLVFSGNDPGDSTWTPLGTFNIGAPPSFARGVHLMKPVGGDTYVLTSAGLFSVAGFLRDKVVSPSSRINPYFRNAIEASYTPRLFYIPSQRLVILGVSATFALCMDQETGAWSQETGAAGCFGRGISFAEVNLAAAGNATAFVDLVSNRLYYTPLGNVWSTSSVVIYTPYTRSKNLRPQDPLQVWPHFFYGAGTPNLSVGAAFNFNNVYNEQTWGASACRTGVGPSAADITYPVSGTTSAAWKTIPGVMAYNFSLSFSASGFSTAANLRFWGWDLRTEVGAPGSMT